MASFCTSAIARANCSITRGAAPSVSSRQTSVERDEMEMEEGHASALSSTEAKYLASSEAAKEEIWLRSLLLKSIWTVLEAPSFAYVPL